jgi:hypothetical protein
VGSLDLTLSWRAVAFLATALVGWLAFIGIPFRIGMMRWRAIWLRTLDTHRAEVGSHMRRLSLADPSTGTQDTSADNLRAMEYDLVLDQYYRTRLDEARHARWSPLGLVASLALLALTIVLVGGADMLLPR